MDESAAQAGTSRRTGTGGRTGTVKAWGLGFALLAAVSFGASGPLAKALINAGLNPLQTVWLRMAGGALILLPIALVLRRRVIVSVRRFSRILIVYGLVGVAGTQTCYFAAASRLPVGVAVLLQFMGPVLAVCWIRFVRRVRVPRSSAIGVATALLGLACIVEIWTGLNLDGVGLAAGLGSGVFMAAYFLIIDRMTGAVDPLVMTAAGTTVATIALGVASSPWTLPWHVLAGTVPFGEHAVPGWTLVAWMILISTVVGELAAVAGVQRLSAPIAGAIAYNEAVAAAVIAWVALGEQLTQWQITGGVIVLAGAYIAQRSMSVSASRSPETGHPIQRGRG